MYVCLTVVVSPMFGIATAYRCIVVDSQSCVMELRVVILHVHF